MNSHSKKIIDSAKKDLKELNKPVTHGITAIVPDNVQKSQTLKIISKKYNGFLGLTQNSDISISSPAYKLIQAFDSIFRKQGFIAEGLLSDIFFGFNVSGWDLELVGRGMSELRAKGYIVYTDENLNKMGEDYFIRTGAPVWVRYTKKFLQMFNY